MIVAAPETRRKFTQKAQAQIDPRRINQLISQIQPPSLESIDRTQTGSTKRTKISENCAWLPSGWASELNSRLAQSEFAAGANQARIKGKYKSMRNEKAASIRVH